MQLRHASADARMARCAGVLEYLPLALIYPARGYGLPVVLMLALLVTVGMGMSQTGTGIPDAGIPLLAISLSWLLIYGLKVIDHTARGYATPPPMTGESLELLKGAQPLVLPALITSAYWALKPVSAHAAAALLWLGLAALPAHLFLLATRQQLLAALDPRALLQVIAAIGFAYLLPIALMALGGWLLYERQSHFSRLPLTLLLFYLLIACLHLLGFVGFRRHGALALDLDVPHPDETSRIEAQATQYRVLLAKLEALQQAHDAEGLRRAILAEPNPTHRPRPFWEDLFWQISRRGAPMATRAAGQRLIQQLLRERDAERALDIAETCVRDHGELRGLSADALLTLGETALRRGQPALFLQLLHATGAMDASPATAALHFRYARYLSETRTDDAAALRWLAPLLAYTDHPEHSRFSAFAKALRALAEKEQRG